MSLPFSLASCIPQQDLPPTSRQELQKKLSEKTAATGIELSNATISLKSGEEKPYFVSINILSSGTTDSLCARLRIYDPNKGKEEFRLISLEPTLKDKDTEEEEASPIKIIDITPPSTRKIIGELSDEEDIPTLINIPHLLIENKTINKFIVQRALSLSEVDEKDRPSASSGELKLLLHPTQFERHIGEEISFSYQVPHGEKDQEGYTPPVDIQYTSSLNRLVSEIGTFFSDNYQSSLEPNLDDPSIMTQKITINSDAIISIDYFGEDEKTKNRVYHIEVRRFDEMKPLTSLQLVEEASGRVTLHSYSSSSRKLIEKEIGKFTERLDFEHLGFKFSSNKKLSQPEKLLIEKLLHNLTSNPRINPYSARLLNDSDKDYGNSFIPIHLEALKFAREKALQGASVLDVFKAVFSGLGLPWTYNGVVRKLSLENLEDPKKIQHDKD